MRHFMLGLVVACSHDPDSSKDEPGSSADPTIPSTAPIDQPNDPPGAPVVTDETVPPAPTGFDVAAELFDGPIPEFDIELSDDSLAALRLDPYTWVEGAVTYRGARFWPVGVRLKGDYSFRPIDEKPSLKVRLNRFVGPYSLLGLDQFTLDNMASDPSMMSERIGYRLFREQGLTASRANHAVVRINGDDRGLYTLVETVDEELLALWYPDPTGALWELSDVDFADNYIDRFEPESGSDDRATLQAIADAIASGGPECYDAADPWVDWTQLVDYTATAVVVGQFDSYPWRTPGDDVHIYFDPADGKMEIIPHGLDEAFVSDDHDVMAATGLLFQICAQNPACIEDYRTSIWDAQATSERIDLLGFANDVVTQIAALAEADPRREYPIEEVLDAQDDLVDFVENRHEHLALQIGEP